MGKSRLLKSGEPFLQIWVGNFFEPFLSDRAVMRKSLEHVKALGFNAVNLDSKAWQDFFDRYAGGAASPYVAMQEFMLEELRRLGLVHTFLALYLCGDNLYPTIRDSPPVRGEDAIGVDGRSLNTYKYWSDKAQESMTTHVRGLLQRYGEGMAEYAGCEHRRPIQTMFEPIVRPSFDAEGIDRYRAWLAKRYAGKLELLNRRYGLSVAAVEELAPDQYWLHPEALNWVGGAWPAESDFRDRTPDLWRWIDNQAYLGEETERYFRNMKRRFRELDPSLMLEPVLQQWGYFFNPPDYPSWQTGIRAIDMHRLAPHLDNVLFISSPLNAEGMPDAGVLSVEYSLARSVNGFGDFTAGLYLGRHVAADIYRYVTPAEAYGTLVANGAGGVHVYGYSGFDDGGVFCMMDELFLESVAAGNRWARTVMPLLEPENRPREAAILFPAQMNFWEPVGIGNGAAHHMDLLGWHKQLVELGYHVDILHPDQVTAGELDRYRILAVPFNSCYDFAPNPALEVALRQWVERGGLLFCGPGASAAKPAFDIQEEDAAFDCIDWNGRLLVPNGWSTVAFSGGTPLARYAASGRTAVSRLEVGQGAVVSFGFEYGYAYARRGTPSVPVNYGRSEAHPLVLFKETPVAALAARQLVPTLPGGRGVEAARFGNRLIVVNHRSEPLDLTPYQGRDPLYQIPSPPGFLAGHSAVCLTCGEEITAGGCNAK